MCLGNSVQGEATFATIVTIERNRRRGEWLAG